MKVFVLIVCAIVAIGLMVSLNACKTTRDRLICAATLMFYGWALMMISGVL